MRENRTCGSEGGEAQSLPYPYPGVPAFFTGAFWEDALGASPMPAGKPARPFQSALPGRRPRSRIIRRLCRLGRLGRS